MSAASEDTGPVRPVRSWSLGRADWLLVVAVAAILLTWLAPGLLSGQTPYTGDILSRLKPPSPAHPFGTDHLGRDIWARSVHGLRNTLNAGLLATGIAFVVGVGLGVAAGWGRRWLDSSVMRVMDMVLALPTLVVVILLVSTLARDTLVIAIAVGFAGIPRFARLMRAEVTRVRRYDYVEASIVSGASNTGALMRHVVPNSLPAAIAIIVVEFALYVLGIASFTFLGLGTPGPQPELGLIVSEGRNYLTSAWWVTALPGTLLVAIVLVMAAAGRRVFNAVR